MEKKFKILIYTAALTTLVAGILHFLKGPNAIDGNIYADILFLVGGRAQIFWIVPIIKQWGKVWYYIGIAGTVIFVLIWIISRIPDNPITGRGGSISNEGITIQFFQLAFIILSILILFKITKINR